MGELARILVVDDDLASRGLMAQILAEDGHQVVVASDGAEATTMIVLLRSWRESNGAPSLALATLRRSTSMNFADQVRSPGS